MTFVAQAVDETFELPASIVAPGENHFPTGFSPRNLTAVPLRDEVERPQVAPV